ncbi:hypothetical protein [Pseudoalteromonas phage PH357]|nr:hypothetical protein [Pseudoalteromonas phage PH357]
MPNDMKAPTLSEVVEEKIAYDREDLSTAIACTVVSYNNINQTIVARPVMYDMDKDGITRRQSDIYSVPVMFPSSGGGSLTFPINKGDPVLVVFSQRAFDTWWVSGKLPSQPSTQRFHDYNDAIAIIGLKSRNKSLQASTENVELRYEDSNGNLINKITMSPNGDVVIENKNDTKIQILNGKVRIENSQEELINILSELIDEISNNTVNTIYGTSPMNSKPLFQALKSRLDTLKD